MTMAMQFKLTANLPSHIIYIGDVKPLDNGGTWLDAREWNGSNRSAEAVEMYPLDYSECPYGIIACRLSAGIVQSNDANEQAYAFVGYSVIYEYGYNPALIAWRDAEELSEEQEKRIARWVEKNCADYFDEKEDAVECAMRMILRALPA
jgi:hypothetical protein